MPAPQGTVSFLFTDIIGSTRLWEKHPAAMGAALARHDELIRDAATARHGHVFKTVGDAFCVAFETPRDALLAAIQAQLALAAENWGDIGSLTVRMGIHTGAAEYRGGDYFGGTLNRASRIEAAAHGGQILLSQISIELLEDDVPDGIAFKSLGDHRLRNLERPEHLYQALGNGLETDFPPPKSMEVLPNNLPVQSTSFIGREHEMEEVIRLLDKNRLVTLTGTGGTGKTRLSLEAGARLINEFRDGVWQIELAPVSDGARIPELIAAALGVRDEPDRPLRETLFQFLKGKSVLLILDNCEHLLKPASALSDELLRRCPNLKILATSRHSLGISGEITLPVPPLGIFDTRLNELTGPNIVERLSQFDAVKLFIERASAVRPDFAVTNANAPALAEICSRLDGIPLAIELAAARVRVLDLDQIAARLDDRFRLLRGTSRGNLPHQQTLQALIDWSHDLLSDSERILFRRMGVFIAGRTLEALETVCAGDGIEDFEILDLLQELVEKSLVTVERDGDHGSRYTMIESVWQYAQEKLEASGERAKLRDRHLDYFMSWAEEAAPHLEGPDQKDWLDCAYRELFNFRAAAQWALESGRAEAGLRIFVALYRLVEIRSSLEETRKVGGKLLDLPGEVPPKVRADALVAMGRLAWAMDHYEEARRRHVEARRIFDEIGDEGGSALTDMLQAFLDRGDGNFALATQRFERGLEVGRRLKIPYIEAGCLSGLGSNLLDEGDVTKARELKEQALKIYERMGDRWIMGLIYWGIVQVAIEQEDYERARSALAQWVKITKDLGNKWIQPYILECYATLAVADNQPERAARIFGAAEVVREHHNTQFTPTEITRHEAYLARLKKMLPEKDLQVAWEAGRQLPAWDAIEEP